MRIRTLTPDDAERFFDMLCRLDEETEYMMYEPGERRERTKDPARLRAVLEGAVDGGDLLLAAETDEGALAGFLWAERGKLNRIRHTAYIVVGVRRAWRGQGLGTGFFHRLETWARDSGVVRLELTVERMAQTVRVENGRRKAIRGNINALTANALVEPQSLYISSV